MRWLRLAAVCALVALLVAGTGPADAHPSPIVYRVDVGVSTPIEILVPADYGRPINGVDISAPTAFRLDGGAAPRGWTLTRHGDTLGFAGGPLPVASPGVLFAVRGAALQSGTLVFPVTTHSPDGSTVVYAGGPGSKNAGVIVYAGGFPSIPVGQPLPWKAVGAATVAGVGLFGTVLWVARRRLPRP